MKAEIIQKKINEIKDISNFNEEINNENIQGFF